MGWRVAVLTTLTLLLAIGALFCVLEAGIFFDAGQKIYTDAGSAQPSVADTVKANGYFSTATALQVAAGPVATGCGLGLLAIPFVFARWWQVQQVRRPAP